MKEGEFVLANNFCAKKKKNPVRDVLSSCLWLNLYMCLAFYSFNRIEDSLAYLSNPE